MVIAPLSVCMSEKALGKASSDSADNDFNLSCRECGKEYDSRQGLVYHYKTDTTECTGLSCGRCDATHLRDRVALYRHMAKVHGVGHSYIDPRLSDSEWYRRAYVDRGLTTTDIADKCGCSPETAREWKRKHGIESVAEYKSRGVGEDNPTWVGGPENHARKQIYYGPDWNDTIRPQVRERDNYRCQACGVDESDLRRELDVHHIVPKDKFGTLELANRLSNLVAFCRPCHRKWEGIPLRPDTGGE